jgi:hypothetical protein
MSKVAIQGNASGTGTFTIAAPNSNSNQTLTLPDNTGTVLSSVSSLAAANLTGSVPKAALPTGSVLQVVQGTYSTETETSSSSYIDTGLSVSITPTSSTSKILALLDMNGVGKNSNNTSVKISLVRGATLLVAAVDAGYTGTSTASYIGSVAITFLDSPSTTSSTTYKAQFSSGAGSASARICSSSSTSILTLMEIAA